MKDKELKLEDIEAPHTRGGASYILFRYIDLAEGDKGFAEVALRKPRIMEQTHLCKRMHLFPDVS
jgi:hypothetical protein